MINTADLLLIVFNGITMLVSIASLVLVFHIGVDGSALKKRHYETHQKTVECVNLLTDILNKRNGGGE